MTIAASGADGSNLASFLYYLRSKERGAYEMIRRTVRLVAPFFDDFILEAAGTGRGQDPAGVAPLGSDAYFDASSLSDGSLRFIALRRCCSSPPGFSPRSSFWMSPS